MGYTTQFDGQINLSRALTAEEQQTLRDFADERHEESDGFPGYYCQWVPTHDGLGIAWDGGEKFYDSVEWMQYLIDRFLTPWGVEAEGAIIANGEDAGDVWRLVVKDGRARRQNASFVFSDD